MSDPIFIPVEADPLCAVCTRAYRLPDQCTKVYVINKGRYNTVHHTHKCPSCGYELPTPEDNVLNDKVFDNLLEDINKTLQAKRPLKLFRRGVVTIIVATVLMYIANMLLDNWQNWYVLIFAGLNAIVGVIGIFMVYDGLVLEYKQRKAKGKE